ncbi:MAG: ATP-binding cassette domain-containing protein, partial [Steroidobacteraceae bacterium]
MAASSAAALTRLECRCLGVVAGGREIVRQLELSLEPGQLLAVLGRNGTGKTLTLLTLAGLRGPGSG